MNKTEKNVFVKIHEVEENIVKILNESGLAATFLELIVGKLHNELVNMKMQEYNNSVNLNKNDSKE